MAQNELSRRNFMQGAVATAAGVGLLAGTQGSSTGQEAAKRPNLLFVFTDQQSRDTLGCYGNEDVITPNLDAFAQQGIQFEHCVSSSPVCTPYRGILLSGQHPLYNGAVHNDIPMLANNGKYFGHALTDAGYRTGYVGKWHLLGHERDRPVPAGKMRYGFDGYFLTNNCHVDYRPGHCYYWNDDDEKIFFDEWEVYGQTRQALDFLDDCSPQDEDPFALFVSWHPPHDVGLNRDTLVFRYDTEAELMDMYDPEAITLRPSAEEDPDVRHAYHGYYAMCTGVDIAFGWLMEKLKERGLDDNTIVVFTSDHGDNLNSYGYRIAKDHPEDTSSRVPFLMKLPEQTEHRKSDLLFGSLDMMPTMLGLLGIEAPETCQGKNLAEAVLEGDDDAVDSVPLFFHNPAWSGVYTRDVTYGYGELSHFAHNEDGNVTLEKVPVRALYDRRNDPYQLDNLYGKPEHAELQARMESLTQEWLDHFGDPGGIGRAELEPYYQLANGRFPEDTEDEGFPGRPIDVIRQHLSTS